MKVLALIVLLACIMGTMAVSHRHRNSNMKKAKTQLAETCIDIEGALLSYGMFLPSETFKAWDDDGNGYISKEEALRHVKDLCAEIGVRILDERQADLLFNEMSNIHGFGGGEMSYDATSFYIYFYLGRLIDAACGWNAGWW